MSVRRRRATVALSLVAVAAAALTSPVAASAAPATDAARPVSFVVNGSFERPVLADGTYSLRKQISGWTATKGRIEIDRGLIGTPAAGAGAQFVELDSIRVSTIEQVVTLPSATQRYSVNFVYAGRPGYDTYENHFLVQLNDTTQDFSVDASGDSDLVWNTGRMAFVAGSTTGTLRFICEGPSTGLGPLIDNVSITPLVG